MKIEESFTKGFIEVSKVYPVLKESTDIVVKIRVGAIMDIARRFHAIGRQDSGDIFDFMKMFGK